MNAGWEWVPAAIAKARVEIAAHAFDPETPDVDNNAALDENPVGELRRFHESLWSDAPAVLAVAVGKWRAAPKIRARSRRIFAGAIRPGRDAVRQRFTPNIRRLANPPEAEGAALIGGAP
jgi:hypothetical protein